MADNQMFTTDEARAEIESHLRRKATLLKKIEAQEAERERAVLRDTDGEQQTVDAIAEMKGQVLTIDGALRKLCAFDNANSSDPDASKATSVVYDDKPTIEEAKAEIEVQSKRREKVQAFIDEQAVWLRVMERFTGSDEQQRIMGDIVHGQEEIQGVDDRLRYLEKFVNNR